MRPRTSVFARVLTCLLVLGTGAGQAGETLSSLTVGPRFQPVHELLQRAVRDRDVAGAVGLVLRDGEVVYFDAVGQRDRERGRPMTADTLFRMASMTKPVTTVAVMMLVEEGKIRLDDPLAKFVPEFADMEVLTTGHDGRPQLVPATRPITIHHLLTHTSGLTYGFMGALPEGYTYKEQGVADGLSEADCTLAENVSRLARCPLVNQPGEAWGYGLSTDVAGRVVEVVSGQSLDAFFRARIFAPLGMNDTHFFVPQEKRDRLAALYAPAEDGIEPVGNGPQEAGGVAFSATAVFQGPGRYFSGGAGLVSTAADYGRFLQMLLNGGELDGARLLEAETVALMTKNHIGEKETVFPVHGTKFGYGFGIHSDVGDRHGASVGTYSWGGIFHTYFWVDPQEELIGIVHSQLFPFDHLSLWTDYQEAVYAALGDHQAAASGAETPDGPKTPGVSNLHERPPDIRDTESRNGPQPGDVYREYCTHNGGHGDWRVTDPQATVERAKAHLPNPVLPLSIRDLDGAVRAEAVLDRWGGHFRTTDRRIRFNGNDWLDVPGLTTPPSGREDYYYFQDNPVIDVPLSHLREGENTFEGACGALEGYGWGQWGLYSLILRVYYDPESKAHATGRIIAPAARSEFGENLTIALDCSPDTERVDVLAWYHGYDENGDGVFTDWHGSYHQPLRGQPAALAGHVGSSRQAPFDLTWNTRWIPDQPPGSVQLLARLQDNEGVWFATEAVSGLSLVRNGSSVRMYPAIDVPERFGVRAERRQSCVIPISSESDGIGATEAVLALRTWHGWDGHHEPLSFNGVTLPVSGKNHHYDFDLLPIPAAAVRHGDNVFQMHSKTEHHMLEVLWPGPALIVRYDRQGVANRE